MLPNTNFLTGRKGLVVGVANDQSIAAGCARAFRASGADLALTYQSEKARRFVEPVAQAIEAELLMPLDVTDPAQLDAVFDMITSRWGKLDFLVHSVAFCPRDDLHGRVVDCSQAGFGQAMDISVHSLIRLAKRAEPLMVDGGTILTVSYHGSEKVVENYNIMGPVKAALEATARYMAAELGSKGIRVNAISPGPLQTRAASGIDHFDELIDDARTRAPLHRLTTIEEVGAMARSRGLPSPEQILEFLKTADAKTGKREIARAFGVKGADRVELKKILRKMADDGLIASRRKRLSDATGLPPVTVLRVVGVDSDGELFAEPAEWMDHGSQPPKILVLSKKPVRRARGGETPALGAGDTILARVSSTGDKTYPYEARIIKQLKGPSGTVVGVFTALPRGGGQIMSANRKDKQGFDVLRGDEGDAKSGDLVRAEITRQRGRGYAQARVVERLGKSDDQRNVSLIAIHQHGIPDEFPKEVIQAAEQLDELKPPKGRTDMRSLPLVTIDPPDARDHDDAVWAAPDDDPNNAGGFKVVVAIADVAAYVRPGSTLDREARLRGNSVYFPDRVVPMLPERLSTDLCSLRGNEDRPAFACFMTFDKHGRKTGHRFDRIWMRSAAKLAYAQAQAAIDGTPDDVTGPLLEPVLKPLWAAYKALKMSRDKREPLELDLPERKLILSDDGEIERVITPVRLDAHKLIEEFMIQANVSAAETLETRKTPLLFRVHDAPSPEKVDALAEFLATLDMSVPKGQVMKPQHFNSILAKVRGGANEELVSQTVLRTQSQAIYTPENHGHFGLNLRRYAHFTSPIRRYADLIVHRALISALNLGDGGLSQFDIDNLDETAGLLCLAERRAMVAERETTDRLIAHFLRGQVGADFVGRITGMVQAGLFVTLEQSGADGFIPARTLGEDYFVHDEASMSMVGERTGETFQLGDLVDVRLAEVTPIAGGLRFEMLSDGKKGKPLPRSNARRRPGKPARPRPGGKPQPKSRRKNKR